jgi:hypothetical protein
MGLRTWKHFNILFCNIFSFQNLFAIDDLHSCFSYWLGFIGLEIKPKGITFVKKLDDRRDGGKFDQKGRHSGSAFVQFKSPEIAEQALKKDRAYMGPRWD